MMGKDTKVLLLVGGAQYHDQPEHRQILSEFIGAKFDLTMTDDLFGNYLPTWLVVRDKEVLKGYFEGESSLYTIKHLKAWLLPVLSWSAFIIMLWIVLLLISVLLRKQWMENEKLSYPIVRLPVAMTTEPSKFFKNKWM
jgi:hypothetical protein